MKKLKKYPLNQYPAEAMALAMIICTRSVKEAMVTGVLVLFGTLVGMIVRCALNGEKRVMEIELMATFFAVFGAIYLVNYYLFRRPETWEWLFSHMVIGLLAAKYVWKLDEERTDSFAVMLKQGAGALVVMVLIALFREALGRGLFLGNELPEFALRSAAFAQPMWGLVLAGIGVAAVNILFGMVSAGESSAVIIITAAINAAPFYLKGVPIVINSVVAAFLVIMYWLAVKDRLTFSEALPFFKGMPTELIAVGFVYMILSFF